MRLIKNIVIILLFCTPCFGANLFTSNFDSWADWTQQQTTSSSQTCYTGCNLTEDWTAFNQGPSQCPADVTGDPGYNSLYVDAFAGYPAVEDTCHGGSGKCITKWMEACDSGDAFDDSDANLGVDLGQEYADVYLRWWVKFPSGFGLINDMSFKLFHAQHYAGGGANPWNYFENDTNNQPLTSGGIRRADTNYVDFYLEARGYPTYYTQGFMFWRLSTYTNALASGGILDGDWHSITLHFHRNSSVGTTDGYIDLWIDGVAKTEYEGYEATGIDWTDSGGDLRGFRFLSIGGNNMKWTTTCSDGTGNDPMSSCEQWYSMDDVSIATTLEDLDAEEPVCDADNLELCTTEEICTGASLNWCDDACQVEECPAAATPLSGVRFNGVRFSM